MENALISAQEVAELNLFEAKKTLEVAKTKSEKFATDNVPVNGGLYAGSVGHQTILPTEDVIDHEHEQRVDAVPEGPQLEADRVDVGDIVVNLSKIE